VLSALVVVAAGASCASGAAASGDPTAEATSAAVDTTSPAPSTSSTAPPTIPACDRRAELDAGIEPAPDDLLARLDVALADPRLDAVEHSVSIWIGGYGEVVGDGAAVPLLPASNQKLFTAIGSRLLLDPGGRFRTEVRLTGDQLVLVAGGDPTLRWGGRHSLADLAAQVRAAGIESVSDLLVDATHFEPTTTAAGWEDWQMPQYVGPLSALTVDDNRMRLDPAYLADPAVGNAELFRTSLQAAGVAVGGDVVHGAAPADAPVVAAVESAPVDQLVREMLTRSDNEIAEALLRQMGGGSTAAGVAAVEKALDTWCLHLSGISGDGSGLSRADRRPAVEWRRLLQVLAEQPWAADLLDGLPLAGRTGTLAGRLGGPTTAGNVRAKTGTIIGGAALSGYATAVDGRPVVFSIVVNGEPAAASSAVPAIDRLVVAVVGP
jgi:serine-type D-Ala-D-Ala carboxypeptidase/endopeptidase (penicillin-binding protein 4)